MATTRTPIERVRVARARRDRSQADFEDTVRDAFRNREGHTVEEIAKAAGLTRVRVYQIAGDQDA